MSEAPEYNNTDSRGTAAAQNVTRHLQAAAAGAAPGMGHHEEALKDSRAQQYYMLPVCEYGRPRQTFAKMWPRNL